MNIRWMLCIQTGERGEQGVSTLPTRHYCPDQPVDTASALRTLLDAWISPGDLVDSEDPALWRGKCADDIAGFVRSASIAVAFPKATIPPVPSSSCLKDGKALKLLQHNLII